MLYAGKNKLPKDAVPHPEAISSVPVNFPGKRIKIHDIKTPISAG
jgi:hypothetical protein